MSALHSPDQLGHTIAHSDPDQTRSLLRILIAALRVDSRRGVLPTYRVGARGFARSKVQWLSDSGSPIVCSPARARSTPTDSART
jgi:hypothetical protein